MGLRKDIKRLVSTGETHRAIVHINLLCPGGSVAGPACDLQELILYLVVLTVVAGCRSCREIVRGHAAKRELARPLDNRHGYGSVRRGGVDICRTWS